MLQLKNSTPFASQIAVLPDPRGIDTLYVTLKAAFVMGPRLTVAEPQPPVVLADEYWGEPGQSSLKYASDIHLTKPTTDVVLIGQAHAPGRKPVPQLDVSLAVGKRQKVVRVFGDRTWQPGLLALPASISKPEPFKTMPLVYERAFGGFHETAGKQPEVLFEARNPVGSGFVGKRKGGELKDLPLPNLEDPADLIGGTRDTPPPAGFGFLAPTWLPRRSFAGTYDEAWARQRAPFLPKDFNPKFFNAAHPDLVCDRYLTGGERIQAVNVTPEGVLNFRLPVCELRPSVRVAGREETPALNLETVLIEPDERRLSLVWRAAVPCDKHPLKVESIVVELDRLDLDGSTG
jgi:hypothetical protein